MSRDQLLLENLITILAREIPGFRVAFKTESKLQRLIGFILFFNPAYMTQYITTIHPVVYFPSREWYYANPKEAFEVLAHEFVHLFDAKKSPLAFSLKYLFPQVLALLALPALLAIPFSGWWLWFLAFIVFALPLPAPWRTYYELRGYAMSLAVTYWRTGSTSIYGMSKYFTTPAYYFMMPFRGYVDDKFKESMERIVTGRIQIDRPYGLVYNLLYEVE